MAKATGPLHSDVAVNSYLDLTFSRRLGQNIVRGRVPVRNPRSPDQLLQRQVWRLAAEGVNKINLGLVGKEDGNLMTPLEYYQSTRVPPNVWTALIAKLIAAIRLAVVPVIILAIVAAVTMVVPFVNEAQADEETKTIHEAAAKGINDDVIVFLAKGVYVNARDDENATPLHWAVRNGHVTVASVLIEKGADVNAKTKDGFTPLHGVVFRGGATMVSLLIDNGADVNAKSNEGWTTLHAAARNVYQQQVIHIVPLLISEGVDVNAKNNKGETPMDIAIAVKNKKAILVFHEHYGRCHKNCQ